MRNIPSFGIIPGNRRAVSCSRNLLLCGAAALGSFVLSCGELSAATILFSEDFQTGSPAAGMPWHGYNGWSEAVVGDAGVRWTTIRSRGGDDRAGAFLYSTGIAGSNGAGRVNYTFGPQPYALADGVYRLSFEVQGRMYKPFQVTLADSSDHRVGLQLGVNGNTNNQGVAGVWMDPAGEVTRYTEGGYNTTNGQTPTNWHYASFYTVHIDINGTGSEMEIDGLSLAPGKVRVIYNTEDASVETFTMVFDLPTAFQNIAAISLMKPLENNVTSWSVDNLVFQVEPIPEPATTALLLLPLAGWMAAKWRRRRWQ